MKRRILAILLSAAMGISVLPVSASDILPETETSDFMVNQQELSDIFAAGSEDNASKPEAESVSDEFGDADFEQEEFGQENTEQEKSEAENITEPEEAPEAAGEFEVPENPLEAEGTEPEEPLEFEEPELELETLEFEGADPVVPETEEIEFSESELFSDAAVEEEEEDKQAEASPFETEDAVMASSAETAYAALIQVQPEDWIKNEDGSFSLQKKARASSDSETAMTEKKEISSDSGVDLTEAMQEETYEEETQQEPTVVVNEPAESFSGDYHEEELVLVVEGETAQAVEELPEDARTDEAPIIPSENIIPQNEEPEYYTAADGLLKIQTGTNAPGYYYFDESGHLYTGKVAVKAGTPGFAYEKDSSYFFMDLKNLEKTEATPADSCLGQLQRNFWYWNGKAFQHFEGGYGRLMPVAEYIQRINNYQGYIKIKDKYYALNNNGVPKVGCKKLQNGYYYYFSKSSTIPGEMVRQAWVTGTGPRGGVWWRFFQKNGRWKVLGNGKQFVVTKLDSTVDPSIKKDAFYVLDKTGFITKKNTMRKARFSNGNEYYCYVGSSGTLVRSSLVTYKGSLYYFGANYRRVENRVVTVGGRKYYFNKNGKAPWNSGWHRVPCAGNRYYYFSNYAIVKKQGWQKVVENGVFKGWFYFNSAGNHYVNKLVTTKKGTKYYFKSTGAAASGFVTCQGILYYFRPSTSSKVYAYAMSGIIRDSKNLVLAYGDPKTKEIIKGWKQLSSYWYYFGQDGRAVRNTSMKKGNTWGYLNSYGRWISGGWIIEKQADGSEKRYYVDPSNGVFYKNCWKNIGGLNYYFTADGSIHTKLDRMPGANFGTYNLSVNRARSQMTAYSADWKTPVRVFAVSVGKDETPTPQGTYTITNTGQRWTALMGPSYGQWASHFYMGCYIHSIPYTYMNTYTMDRTGFCLLGTKQSHGCIRMRASDVYWTYVNCNGAQIRIYDTEPLPLGPGKNWWIPEGQFYDPTDWTVPENNLSGPLWD